MSDIHSADPHVDTHKLSSDSPLPPCTVVTPQTSNDRTRAPIPPKKTKAEKAEEKLRRENEKARLKQSKEAKKLKKEKAVQKKYRAWNANSVAFYQWRKDHDWPKDHDWRYAGW
jgi:hypothetical protein